MRRIKGSSPFVLILAILCMVAGVALIALGTRSAPAHASTGCPNSQPVVSCVLMTDTGQAQTGLQVADNPGRQPGTPFMVTDPAGAPMWWTNLYGSYSDGDGGKMPGGLVCVTYGVTSTSACLTPEGTLTLQATGPTGPVGPTVTLTPADILYLHQLEAAGSVRP